MEVSSHSLFLLQQLNIQREFGFLCDCTVAIGNVYFKAHRAVLAAFSNYFKMIFIHQSSECIKIQPTDIQPDIFSYLLHIMYTGMGPKQQVDQSRLQEGIKFLHAHQLCRSTGEAGQDADAAKMSNLYGIQISSQSATKEHLTLKDCQVRSLEGSRPNSQAEGPQTQTSVASGPEGESCDRRPTDLHCASSMGSTEDSEACELPVRVKQEKMEMEVTGKPQTGSPSLGQDSPGLGLLKENPRVLCCHFCGERCSSRQGLREHLLTHSTSSLPFSMPAILENSHLGEVAGAGGEDLEGPDERLPHQGSFLVGKSAGGPEPPDVAGLEEALQRSEALSEELAADRKSGTNSRKRKIACAICSLRFTQKSQLQEHMYSHTGKQARYHRYSRLCSQFIQASQHFCESPAEFMSEEANRDTQDNVSSCYSLDSEVSQESIDTVVVE
ncbi:zinc finger and BTB domain-containing protein 25 [Paramormyrops kingsleyae]|uniref:Zinc finger and BTB domain containing 25 n=1 Tax=Paramormyrops kingsleyae TaxID=1676925 RepID=A0A3B3RNI8_9TELE|nr:zinc finger and BTB domain-containing protein 25 [Paramormyrops kingsleyae]XP_023658084.1 zinc finger and BTB domain-containing protein 25 [Paramormyrops kingsleyae]